MGSAYDPNIMDLIEAKVTEMLRDYQAPQLGVVVAYNAEARRADVLPLVGTPQIDDVSLKVTWSEPVQIPNVPIADFGTDRSRASLGLQQGDRVLLLPMMHSLDELKDSDRSGPTEPADPRQQDIHDVVALPVSWSPVGLAEALADRAIGGSDIRLGDGSAKQLAFLESLENLVADFNTHTHPVTAVGSPTGIPVDPTGPATGTSKVKAS